MCGAPVAVATRLHLRLTQSTHDLGSATYTGKHHRQSSSLQSSVAATATSGVQDSNKSSKFFVHRHSPNGATTNFQLLEAEEISCYLL